MFFESDNGDYLELTEAGRQHAVAFSDGIPPSDLGYNFIQAAIVLVLLAFERRDSDLLELARIYREASEITKERGCELWQ